MGRVRNLPSPLGDATFRITADSINVALRPRGNRASSASIRLAETAVHVGPANGMLTLTRYVLAPEGLDQCVVKLPAGERLVQITLDGHPALARARSAPSACSAWSTEFAASARRRYADGRPNPEFVADGRNASACA